MSLLYNKDYRRSASITIAALLLLQFSWAPIALAAPKSDNGRPAEQANQGNGNNGNQGNSNNGNQGNGNNGNQGNGNNGNQGNSNNGNQGNNGQAQNPQQQNHGSLQQNGVAGRRFLKSEDAVNPSKASRQLAQQQTQKSDRKNKPQEAVSQRLSDQPSVQMRGQSRERINKIDREVAEKLEKNAKHVEGIMSSLTKLNKKENAKWDKNPHDTRGQGNNGLPDMRDPYGHDKDSGREKSERGRPIREKSTESSPVELEPQLAPVEEPPVVDLAALAVVDFEVMDSYLKEMWGIYEYVLSGDYGQWLAATYPDYYASVLAQYQQILEVYNPPYTKISVLDEGVTIDYSVSVPQEYAGQTLLVTTTLVSLENYDDIYYPGYYIIDETTGDQDWKVTGEVQEIHIQTGDLLVNEAQEVTVGADGSLTINYDPPVSLVGDNLGYGEFGGYLAQLSVTVTDPNTGASYTTTYEKDINLYRCPYGIVYDKITGSPIAGAIVTVHNADGSVVMLEKASNPNATNPQTTDATGRYNAKLQIGKKYYLTVKAPGYQDYKSGLFSERWHIVREDVAMTPEDLPAPVVDSTQHPATLSPALLQPKSQK